MDFAVRVSSVDYLISFAIFDMLFLRNFINVSICFVCLVKGDLKIEQAGNVVRAVSEFVVEENNRSDEA